MLALEKKRLLIWDADQESSQLLAEAEPGSCELNVGLPHGGLEPSYLEHYRCVPGLASVGSWTQGPAL